MDLNVIKTDSIRAALLSQSGDIYNSFDADRFLLGTDLYKHTGARFLCWMIKMKILHPFRAHWITTLDSLYNRYRNMIYRLFPDKLIRPLSRLSPQIMTVVEGDTSRTVIWFRRLAEEMGIQSHYLDDSKFRAQRIISAISLEYPDSSYTQGNDRFVWISYLVSLFFSTKGGLDRSFAEGMAFYLSYAWLQHCKVGRNIENISFLENHFSKLDALLEREEPEVFALLSECNHHALQYAMKWELTFFADEHNAHELLLIWDYIVQEISEVGDFVRCLSVAHIRQVQIPKMADEMAMCIQRNRNWDVQKIVSDAKEMMEDQKEEACCMGCIRAFVNFLNENARR
ncbi:hypothetical protein TRFO_38057 [Tritrichomonas foetus]|uniref:Rab-GAP TBC domain-containing protein n=1 Tax=Tritrichomonas foetus TaxID=1144522 RepID=A0A1J4JAW4_9EUKA|nr:hypothetical protein TRFO_38057 [Tritrichomonas foetus]|eukprot:OHS95809.1 hypothetical protein TRFO_38057 [Tritrichomonas foetus]